jgi:hypothetical protein
MKSAAGFGSVVTALGLAAIAFFVLGNGGSHSCLARSNAPGKATSVQSSSARSGVRRSAATQPAASRPAVATRPATTQPSPQKVTVYYFHRTLRCPTCRRIEELAREAVKSEFPGELAVGSVEWKLVNVETRGNEHFEKDYKLDSQSLVLVKTDHGRPVSWQNLPKIWDLVEDPAAFTKYVQDGLRGYLYGEAANHP